MTADFSISAFTKAMDAASLRAFDTLAAATAAAIWPAVITIGGVSMAATIVPPRQGSKLTGFAEEPDTALLIVRILKTVHPAQPVANVYLTYKDARWKIRTVQGGDRDAQWTLTCEPAP